MRVEEYHLIGKTPDESACEDEIVTTDDFAAVLDGTTSIVSNGEGEMTSGKKAVTLLSKVIKTMPGDTGMQSFFCRLNETIADMYRREGTTEQARCDPQYRSSAAAVVYSRVHSEVWLIGDCQALLDDQSITAWKDADRLLSEVRALYLESELLNGVSIAQLRRNDTGRAYIRELLIRQKKFQNSKSTLPYAYHVIDGFLDDIDRAVKVVSVPKACRHIVLASDGYPILKPTWQETEKLLQEIIREDPLCFRTYKSTKGVYHGNRSFDDRAYLSVRL